MAWYKRQGLYALSSNEEYIYALNMNQHVYSRLSWATFLGSVFGGEGIYIGGALNFSELGPSIDAVNKTQYPASTIILYDENSPWFFSTDTYTNIDFSSAGVSFPSSHKLYAVIDLVSGATPDAAIGGVSDITFLALPAATTAPNNALLLGTGTVNATPDGGDWIDHKFTSYTAENVFVSLSFDDLPFTWKLSDQSLTEITIEADDTLNIIGGNGMSTEVSSSFENVTIQANVKLKPMGGLQINDWQLEVKLKDGGDIAKDSSGLYRTNITSDTFSFDIDGDSGTQTITTNDVLQFKGGTGASAGISTSSDGVDLTIDLPTNEDSAIILDSNELEILVKPLGGITQTGTGALQRTAINYSLICDTGTQSILETNTLQFLATAPLTAVVSATNKVYFDLTLATNSGLEFVGNELGIQLKTGGGLAFNEYGLYDATSSPGSTYGPPATGIYTTGDLYTDKSGALFYCTNGATSTWLQMTTGIREYAEYSELPLANEFDSGSRQHTYRILWMETEDSGSVWSWWNFGPDNDYDYGFWISDNVYDKPFAETTTTNNMKVAIDNKYDGILIESVEILSVLENHKSYYDRYYMNGAIYQGDTPPYLDQTYLYFDAHLYLHQNSVGKLLAYQEDIPREYSYRHYEYNLTVGYPVKFTQAEPDLLLVIAPNHTTYYGTRQELTGGSFGDYYYYYERYFFKPTVNYRYIIDQDGAL